MSFGKRKTSPFRTFLKWLAGIMLLAVFTITTGIYIIYRITAPDIAVPALGRIMESAVQSTPMGSIDRVREEVMRRGNLTVEPIAGITVQVDREKIQGLRQPGNSRVISSGRPPLPSMRRVPTHSWYTSVTAE